MVEPQSSKLATRVRFSSPAPSNRPRAARDNPDKVNSGIEKGGDFADDKTGGKHTDKIDKGEDQVGDRLGSNDGDSGDTKNATAHNK